MSFVSRYLKISLLISSVTHWLFRAHRLASMCVFLQFFSCSWRLLSLFFFGYSAWVISTSLSVHWSVPLYYLIYYWFLLFFLFFIHIIFQLCLILFHIFLILLKTSNFLLCSSILLWILWAPLLSGIGILAWIKSAKFWTALIECWHHKCHFQEWKRLKIAERFPFILVL